MFDTFDALNVERLRGIGLAPRLLQQLLQTPSSQEPPEDALLMRVTEVQRDALTLHDGTEEHPARALPGLLQTLRDQQDALAVGDWVFAQRNVHGQWWVPMRVPPLTQIARRVHDGRDKVARAVIVSNVDTALLVMGLDLDFSLRRLERYLALVRLAEVDAVVVLTKADLCSNAEERVQQAQALAPPGVVVLAVDATHVSAAEKLAPWLGRGHTVVLLGSSGTGKSTLTNTLTGAVEQLTGSTRSGDGRGRHTTTARSLHVATAGGCIIDTPGLRTLRLDSEAGAITGAFDDIAQLASLCRFRDCQHAAEPGCAVREGVARARLQSFQKLLRETRRDTMSALQRKEQLQSWKVRSRAARVRDADKRGERSERDGGSG
jgi:ribosome biogenesis GTPase / thiamine phosphate phosphatase